MSWQSKNIFIFGQRVVVERERMKIEKLLSDLHALGHRRPVYYHPVVNIYDVPLNRKGRHKIGRGAGRNLRLRFIKGPGYLFLKRPSHGATGPGGRPYGPIVILYRGLRTGSSAMMVLLLVLSALIGTETIIVFPKPI